MLGFVVTENRTMEWREFPRPKVCPRGALIETRLVSPCTTDVHAFETGFKRFPYMIGRPFGHEMTGVVTEVGAEVRDFHTGDEVAVSAFLPAPVGFDAMAGLPQNRDTSYFSVNDPERAGCFVEYYYVKDADTQLAHIPAEVMPVQALMATDMMATAIAGVEEADIRFGDSVAVLGIGPVGLCCVRAAVLRGAGRVFAIGSRQVCFDVAKEYGATDCIDYHDPEYHKEIKRRNRGRLDKVIVAGGTFASIADGLKLLRYGGKLVNLVSFADETDAVLPASAWGHGKPIVSCSALGGRYHMERMLELIAHGRFWPEKLITHEFHGKENLERAVLLFLEHDRSLIKPVVYF